LVEQKTYLLSPAHPAHQVDGREVLTGEEHVTPLPVRAGQVTREGVGRHLVEGLAGVEGGGDPMSAKLSKSLKLTV
jgi:hypothetical protein